MRQQQPRICAKKSAFCGPGGAWWVRLGGLKHAHGTASSTDPRTRAAGPPAQPSTMIHAAPVSIDPWETALTSRGRGEALPARQRPARICARRAAGARARRARPAAPARPPPAAPWPARGPRTPRTCPAPQARAHTLFTPCSLDSNRVRSRSGQSGRSIAKRVAHAGVNLNKWIRGRAGTNVCKRGVCLTSNPMRMCRHKHSIDTSTYNNAIAASNTRWQAKRMWRQRGQQAAEQQGVAAIQVHAMHLRIAPAQQAARPCQCHLWEPAHTHMACTRWTVAQKSVLTTRGTCARGTSTSVYGDHTGAAPLGQRCGLYLSKLITLSAAWAAPTLEQ